MNEHNRDYDYIGAPYVYQYQWNTCLFQNITHSTVYERQRWKKICITPNYDHSNKSGMGVTAMNIFGTSISALKVRP